MDGGCMHVFFWGVGRRLRVQLDARFLPLLRIDVDLIFLSSYKTRTIKSTKDTTRIPDR
jgi:hypothetical protein